MNYYNITILQYLPTDSDPKIRKPSSDPKPFGSKRYYARNLGNSREPIQRFLAGDRRILIPRGPPKYHEEVRSMLASRFTHLNSPSALLEFCDAIHSSGRSGCLLFAVLIILRSKKMILQSLNAVSKWRNASTIASPPRHFLPPLLMLMGISFVNGTILSIPLVGFNRLSDDIVRSSYVWKLLPNTTMELVPQELDWIDR